MRSSRTASRLWLGAAARSRHGDWIPPIVKTVASRAEGIEELDAAIGTHLEYLKRSGELDRRNRERVRIRIETMLKEKFLDRLIGRSVSRADYDAMLEDVLRKRNNPHDAAEQLLTRYNPAPE